MHIITLHLYNAMHIIMYNDDVQVDNRSTGVVGADEIKCINGPASD